MFNFLKISKKLIVALGFSVITLYLGFNLFYNKNLIIIAHEPIIGEDMPAFKLPLLNNLQVFLDQSSLKNKVTIINIWSSNCKACKREHKTLLNIAAYLKNKHINFIGLNCKDNPEQAIEWLQKHHNPYSANLFDQQGELAISLGSITLPDLFIIDTYNKIQFKHSGIITNQVLENKIIPLLEKIYLDAGR